uniref:RGS domain-containing protein n=1 Tax=Panagrolaimus sp. ES5 TaxID=591445 RepID=A0AC34F7R9_9BILA
MASKRHRLSFSPPTPFKSSATTTSSSSSSHDEACFSALILQAAAIQTLKEMMGESDWRMTTPSTINRGQQILSRFAEANQFSTKSAASSCYQSSNGSGIPKKRSSHAGAMINGMHSNSKDLSSPSTSSSSNSSTRNAMLLNGRNCNNADGGVDFSTSNSSSSISGINYNKRGGAYKRFTLPSIMTTSDSNSEFSEPISLDPIDYHYLYADEAPIDSMTEEHQQQPPSQQQQLRPRRQRRNIGSMDSNMPFTHEEEDDDIDDEEENHNNDDGLRFKNIAVREIQEDVKKVGHKFGGFHPSVRRVASFTSPPTKTQIAKAAEKHQREQRRGFLGKTLHFLRNKVDTTLSQPSLIPTREEVKSWNEKMENIFDSKFGVMIFREFLEKEFSAENLDFLLKCREYQKLFENEKKNSKKIARLAKEIYDDFVAAEIAPKEINIEAQIRASTKAAVNETLKENTFSLAQKQIQTLIENDKYPRFLKSQEYQNLLQSVMQIGSQCSIQSALPELPFTDSDSSSTPCHTGNEDTPLAPANRTLRSASALETLGSISTINE